MKFLLAMLCIIVGVLISAFAPGQLVWAFLSGVSMGSGFGLLGARL